MAAGLGGLGALAAAPIDAGWHEAYGRDAVLWSPPHMLVVFSATALTLGVISGLPRAGTALRAAAGVLLLANAMAVVFEFEADVPQFTEVVYLPILVCMGLLVAGVLSRTVSVRAPVTLIVLGYAAVRLAVTAGLIGLGRSTPDLPIAVLGLAAYDLPLRSRLQRSAAAALAMSALAWAASGAGVASPSAAAMAQAAIPLVVVALAGLVWARPRRALGVAAVALVAGGTLWNPEPAEAHDPGQGEFIATVELTASSDGNGAVKMQVRAKEHCDDLTAQRVVARRAGTDVTAALERVGSCRFAGALDVDDGDRWFVYVEFSHDAASAEAWLPVDTSEAGSTTHARPLYLPAGADSRVSATQIAWGGVLYLLGLALLAVGINAVSRQGATAGGADLADGPQTSAAP